MNNMLTSMYRNSKSTATSNDGELIDISSDETDEEQFDSVPTNKPNKDTGKK